MQGEDVEIKFILVVCIGTTLSFLSILESLLILFIFLSRAQFRISHLFYFSVLAGLDILLSVSYVALMSVQGLMIYYRSPLLARYWYSYLRVLFTLAHIWMTASSFLIVAATFERYSTSVSINRFEFNQGELPFPFPCL